MLHGQNNRKGKPFRRTILNKVYELRKRVSEEGPARYGTRLSFLPGEGKKSLYEGVPDRFHFESRKTPDMRDPFRRPRHSREEYDSAYEDEYRSEHKSEYAHRMRRMGSERRRRSYEDEFGESSRRILADDYAYRVESPVTDNSEEFPERRIKKYRSVEGRDAFDTWKDHTVHRKSEERYHSQAKPLREMKSESRRAPGYKKSDRRSPEKKYDQSDRPLPGNKSSRGRTDLEYKTREPKSDRRSSEKKYDQSDRPLQGSKSSGREKDLEHKTREPGKDESVKKLPPNVQKRMMQIRENIEKEMGPRDHQEKDESMKKLPPDVQKRMKQIHENIEKEMGPIDNQHIEKSGKIRSRQSLDSIDLTKHKGHPDDHGHTHKEEYEKYATKNGSEVWVRKEENSSELHHKNSP